ncbi:class I SAM-dependent methyltransferase [Streptomyces specialis]|uniref:class I SAM-dependent methyltransferase n=1 Tax=Streptomyces specialis TaxID=498367 RepID=UPI00073E6003|nr:class I SAM-dependent methyltransferase [Streptomyces specialis]
MDTRTAEIAELRDAYRAELAAGIKRFFLPRRTTCPWCESSALTLRMRTRDWVQGKPGLFTLDRCRNCGHVFQNPRLNQDGLDFYYRDFYDGLGRETTETVLQGRGSPRRYEASVDALTPHIAPRTWLDVGTSYGFFCAAAKKVLPGTEFDGLDMGEAVEDAAKAGRISHAYRGLLTELAGDLAGRYDTVSMFHYLEHTLDPRAELQAARTALRPGGHLLIEIPDPQSLSARLLGKWWVPWFQPQHLQLMPSANLREELNRSGFSVVAEERGTAHIPVDLIGAGWFVLNQMLPKEDAPWREEPPPRLAQATRKAGLLAGLPVLLGLHAVELLASPLARRSRLANAYRLIARRDN